MLFEKNLLTLLKIIALAAVLFLLSFFLKGIEYVVLLLSAIIIHEIGHLTVAKLFKIRLIRNERGFLRLSYKFDFSSSSYISELAVSLAGVGFNLAAVFLATAVLNRQTTYSLFFIFSNLSLAFFNLMPISSLDGSGALRALLSLPLGQNKAEKITNCASFIFAAIFFVFSIYVQLKVGVNFSLMLISLIMVCNCIKLKERL